MEQTLHKVKLDLERQFPIVCPIDSTVKLLALWSNHKKFFLLLTDAHRHYDVVCCMLLLIDE